jgi:putative phosphonate transport system ATP-binding protein
MTSLPDMAEHATQKLDRPWVLKADKLTKRYGPGCVYCSTLTGPEQGNRCPMCGTVIACADVSFTLGRGEVLGIVGESGSGKSTLMEIINLNLPADDGKLLFQDLDKQGNVTGAPTSCISVPN